MQDMDWGWTMVARLLTATGVVTLGACGGAPLTFHELAPPLKGAGTYHWTRGTVSDGPGGPTTSCLPEAPPAPALPTVAAGQLLVGYQDWRNTATDPGGVMCPSSRATRWQALAVFDMSHVTTDLSTAPHRTLTATLTYKVGSTSRNPQSAQAFDLCVRTLELARGYETPPAFSDVTLDPQFGAFPSSASSRLGVMTLPQSVPLGRTTVNGPTTVDPSPPSPTVTVDVSVLLSDWAESLATEPAQSAERDRFGIAFHPFGPTIRELGLTDPTPRPVPANRSTAVCTSMLFEPVLHVRVGR